MAASSLDQLDLFSGEPQDCSLFGCDRPSHAFPCSACADAPNPDFLGALLEDVRYCSEAHRIQDLMAHKNVCRNRHWLRDGSRIGQMHYELFLATREEMYTAVVAEAYTNAATRRFTMKRCEAPAPEEPFYGTELDPASKLCAISVNACVWALMLGSPFLAYMTKGL